MCRKNLSLIQSIIMTSLHTRIFFKFMIIGSALLAMVLSSCIDDSISGSPAHQPSFSVDTLHMGTVFTDQVTTTYRMTVYNRNSEGIAINDIHLEGPNASLFRLNVDGMSGTRFSDVEIRAKDSIYVLVESTLPENGVDLPVDINADLVFVTAGVSQKVVINAQGQDVVRLRHVTVDRDMRLTAGKPYQIFDSLVVAPGATLTIEPGAKLCFHDGAPLIVRGTLKSLGTPEKMVNICGDRTGNVITDITFDLMSRQWPGIQFAPSSHDNVISHTSVRNTDYGVIVNGGEGARDDASPMLTLINSQLRNSGDFVLEVYNADILAAGCEFAEAANGLVRLESGKQSFNQCTFANYYLFSALGGPAIQFAAVKAEDVIQPGWKPTTAEFTNSIIYGNGSSLSHGDLSGTGIFFRYCLLKESGSNDDNFIECLWDKDPLYYTVREDYIFDYRLKPDSPAIGAGSAALVLDIAKTDFYGRQRGSTPDIGAYVFTPPAD